MTYYFSIAPIKTGKISHQTLVEKSAMKEKTYNESPVEEIHMPKDIKIEDMKSYCEEKVKELLEKYKKIN